MKKLVNKNILWCNFFAELLHKLGVKNVCISPGSRSTSLTFAFASSNKFKIFPIVDERSSGFFALGLAKQTSLPVVVVTTSGTAVAELYPAIIEAFYQRIPLIVCTADRPPYLRNKGANQTINQDNIYKNHIRFFAELGIPQVSLAKLKTLKKITIEAFTIALYKNPGPVHINFPFEKPFEPGSFTNEVDEKTLSEINKLKSITFHTPSTKVDKFRLESISKKIIKNNKGIIVCGNNNFSEKYATSLTLLSEKTGFPIFADGSSGLRYGKHSKKNIIENFNSLIRVESFIKNFDPEVIIHFGGSPTANQMHSFVKNSKAEKILINEFGDINDPSLTAKTIIKIKPEIFCYQIIKQLKNHKPKTELWKLPILKMNELAGRIKDNFLSKVDLRVEPSIINNLVDSLPLRCNLMVSNSLPIRDNDFFSKCSNKEIKIFSNRGASGIDGINSTALGIAEYSINPTILLTGDLAFYHDLTGLYNSEKFNIPLIIVLINNNGGGIFESLPISTYGKIFYDYFVTSLKLDFSKVVKAFNGIYYIVNEAKQFKVRIRDAVKNRRLTVIEIGTDAKYSNQMRLELWQITSAEITKYINDLAS
jgi:2-succinyl-5-enolpyruvyl-6-hydroxy-3-cyclohexene-1-carboxylate synthase